MDTMIAEKTQTSNIVIKFLLIVKVACFYVQERINLSYDGLIRIRVVFLRTCTNLYITFLNLNLSNLFGVFSFL